MSLPNLSISRPVGVAMFYIAIICLGIISFTRLPVDLLPDIAYPKLVVYTTYPNVAPAEVERFVTEPVEQRVSTVPGVEKVESLSREGVSLVLLRFAWGTDMDFAALNVREKLDQLRESLPDMADRPVVLRTDPRSEPIMSISVTALAPSPSQLTGANSGTVTGPGRGPGTPGSGPGPGPRGATDLFALKDL